MARSRLRQRSLARLFKPPPSGLSLSLGLQFLQAKELAAAAAAFVARRRHESLSLSAEQLAFCKRPSPELSAEEVDYMTLPTSTMDADEIRWG